MTTEDGVEFLLRCTRAEADKVLKCVRRFFWGGRVYVCARIVLSHASVTLLSTQLGDGGGCYEVNWCVLV